MTMVLMECIGHDSTRLQLYRTVHLYLKKYLHLSKHAACQGQQGSLHPEPQAAFKDCNKSLNMHICLSPAW
jgi:hypothetical protein